MVEASAKRVAMACICIATMLISTAAELPPLNIPPGSEISGILPPLKGAEKCWSRLTNIPGCHSEIFYSLVDGRVSKISHACCDGINQVSSDCWPKMYPFHATFPALLKRFCSAPSPAGGDHNLVAWQLN